MVTARQLFAVIPEGAKSAIMRVTGISDGATGSEHYRFGGCYLRDTRLDLDTDGDGANDAAELFAGTDPTNPTSVLRISRFAIQSDATGPYVVIDWNAVNNRRYSLDISRDNGKNWECLLPVWRGQRHGRLHRRRLCQHYRPGEALPPESHPVKGHPA